MYKILLKKQLREIFYRMFSQGRNNKKRSHGATIATIVLISFAFLLIAVAFFGISAMFSMVFVPMGYGFVLFTIVDVVALVLGVFGSVFNTAFTLYKAKDNEILLSMPIPVKSILLARMSGVYLSGVMYGGVVLIPSVLAFCIFGRPGIIAGICSFIHIIVITFMILVISCFMGWLVSIISSKLKNKSIITVLLALVFFGAYYYASFNFGSVTQILLDNPTGFAESITSKAALIYFFTMGAAGNVLYTLITVAIIAGILFFVIHIMSKTFASITSVKDARIRAEYSKESIKYNSLSKTLFNREWKRYINSAVYMLNSSLSTVLMPVVGIVVLVFSDSINPVITEINQVIPVNGCEPAVACGFFAILISMNTITAASISLEGNNLWVIKTLPIPTISIFNAKQYLHWIVTMPFAVFMAVATGVGLGFEMTKIFLMVIFVIIYTMFASAFGLFLNLKRPSFDWTSEASPVKNSIPVFVCVFGGMIIGIIIAISGVILSLFFDIVGVIVAFIILFVLFVRIINRWLSNRGVKLFEGF